MPPPKQNPTAPILASGARRSSSSSVAFMSARNLPSGALFSAAETSASFSNEAVPPSAESRSTARAE